MTVGDFMRMVNDEMTMPRCPFNLVLYAERREYGEMFVGVYGRTGHRDTGAPVQLGDGRTIPVATLENMDRQTAIGWVFHCVVLETYRHEASEFFLVAGERVFDPHRVRT